MITAASADYGTLASLVADAASTRQRLDRLTNQASTGQVADNYAGLGAGASVSLNLSPEVAHLQSWQANIAAASGTLGVTQDAMTQIQQIANTLQSQLNGLQGANGSEIDTIAASARSALVTVAGLLDSSVGGTYVFAGSDSGNPPVPNPDGIRSSGFFTQIAAAVSGLSANGAAATASATLAVASSNAAGTSPFSAALSQPAAALQSQLPLVQAGPGQGVQAGLLASANAFVPSNGSSTTGSYMRDLMRALATVGSLDSSQQSAAGFNGLVQDTRDSLRGAIGAMAQDAGVLGDRQSALDASTATLQQTTTALQTQLSSVQDADMASTLSQITLVQTQLQASYQLLASAEGLSLVKFLGVG